VGVEEGVTDRAKCGSKGGKMKRDGIFTSIFQVTRAQFPPQPEQTKFCQLARLRRLMTRFKLDLAMHVHKNY